MWHPMGEILEVQIKLPAGYVGEFVRVRANINVKKRLARFVSSLMKKIRFGTKCNMKNSPPSPVIVD